MNQEEKKQLMMDSLKDLDIFKNAPKLWEYFLETSVLREEIESSYHHELILKTRSSDRLFKFEYRQEFSFDKENGKWKLGCWPRFDINIEGTEFNIIQEMQMCGCCAIESVMEEKIAGILALAEKLLKKKLEYIFAERKVK